MPAIAAFIKKWMETSSKKQKLIAALVFFSLLATGVLFAAAGASQAANDPLGSTPFYYVSAFVKLIVVLLLIVGSSALLRRWLQIGPSGRVNRQMRLIETIRLSPKQALHLIVVGGQKFLVGATDQNVSLIASVDYNIEPAPAEETQPQQGLDFGSLLQTFNLNQPGMDLKGKE
jgi:flagellar biosynthetic protein FliO